KLIQEFIKAAEVATATVEVIPTDANELNKALVKAIDTEESILFAQPDDLSKELFSEFVTNPKVVNKPTNEQLSTIKCGVTDAFGGVAATGSVCVSVTKNLTSPVSMLTRKHIVVVDSKSIVPRPRDVLSEEYLEGKGLRRSFSFITGSSATADMGPLVRGVHGPGRLHIIILD
ncbi:MAG: LUD domain-containing protein, partial [Bacteroidota bacterium]